LPRSNRLGSPRGWALTAALSWMLLQGACDIRIVGASVVSGPDADGAITVRLDLELPEVDPPAEGEQPQIMSNQLGYLAVATSPGIAVTGARLLGEAALVGPSGKRRMGSAPQVVQAFQREYVEGDQLTWSAFHVMVDQVDPYVHNTFAVEVDLASVPEGETTLLVAPGIIDAGTTDVEAAAVTRLVLVSGGGKGLIRVEGK
jgi:hypothetical protein